MKPGTYKGEWLTLTVDKTGEKAILDTGEQKLGLSDKVAREFLQKHEPDMKNRGHFLVVYGPLILRSSDVKDLVKILRKACK